jgi:hypothetical protein
MGRSWSVQLMNETRWPSRSGRHEWKVAFESLFDRVSERRGASLGRFEFASIDDFIAGQPDAFTRTLSTSSTSVRGAHLGLGVGDSYSPSRSLAWQFGLRAEGHGLVADDGANGRADSVFGVRTGVLPMRFSVAPMAGFTWKYHRNRAGYPDNYHTLAGGIRDYRASISTRSAGAVFGGGFGQGSRQLRCVDAATPKPEWAQYEGSAASIPASCAQAVDDPLLAQSAFPVALFAPTFALGHSVRTDLHWTSPIATGLYLSVHGMTAINTHQPSTVDLNFNGASQFRLDGEAQRPVFVTAGSIGAASGMAATVASRRDPQFSSVNERRSDLRSRASALTTTLTFRPAMARFESGIKVPLTVSYTWFDTREQRNGFTGTTAGDPRLVEWQPSAVGRHAVLMSAALHVPDWFRLTAGVQWRSGARYTPTVLGDINGDGIATNDRAFILDPMRQSDSALRSGMTRLLATAPPSAQRCLRAQIGIVAGANSCTGPASATLNAVVTIDPARVRLQNRGAIQLRVNNVLAGLDQLAHGAEHIHGWGQPVYPDPVLLRVTGFDPVAQRYRYDVNRSFGDPRPFQRFFYSPFRVTLEVAIDIGPDREQSELDRRLSPPREGRARIDSAVIVEQLRRAHDPRNLFEPVLRRADEFQLTEPQRDSLERLGQRHSAFRDSAYAALASFVAARNARLTDEEVRREWREALRAVARFEWQMGATARQILTPVQAEQVFDRNGPLGPRPIVFDARELERYLKLWQERVF